MDQNRVLLADLTTMRVGGPAAHYCEADSAQELAQTIVEADQNGVPVLVIGGGSNLLVGDAGFDGLVIKDRRQEITEVDNSSCGGISVRASAGTNWDSLVSYAIENDLMGVEALSGIPGTVGAAPVQNIGAYGQEAAETLASVRVLDRLSGKMRTMALAELRLGYRQSIIKESLTQPGVGGGRTWGPTGRWVVLEVEFQFRHASLSAPVKYAELAKTLDLEVGQRAPSKDVRQAVLQLRAGKGMVLNSADHDTWSAGSFFTNPILSEEQAELLPVEAPRFPVEQRSMAAGIAAAAPEVSSQVKTSAAWLINHAGFSRGYRVSEGARAALSTKHVLALTNRGGATAEDVLALAMRVREVVKDRFGIDLVPEPVFVGL